MRMVGRWMHNTEGLSHGGSAAGAAQDEAKGGGEREGAFQLPPPRHS